jgi:hypothetical protein
MKIKNTNRNTKSIIDANEETRRQIEQAGVVDMRYRRGNNNTQTGNIRTELTLKIAVRFGLTSASVLAGIYNMRLRQVNEHLAKLVKKNLLTKVNSNRSVDGAVFVPTATGAQMVKDHLNVPIYFRRHQPGREVNHLAVSHDLINQYYLIKNLELSTEFNGDYYYKHTGVVSELETKRIVREGKYRVIDGAFLTYNHEDERYHRAGIEYENSYKNPTLRSKIIQAYLALLRDKIYDTITLVSHDKAILIDAKRINDKLVVDLCNVRKSDGSTIISGEDAALLEEKIEYDDRLCDELTAIFYR